MPVSGRHVLAGSIVAFIAWAFLTDYQPTLRWLPHAFLAGALATLAALLALVLTTTKPLALSRLDDDPYTIVAPTAPAFTTATAWPSQKAALLSRAEYRRPLIFPEAFAFSKALDTLLDRILRDYVTSWYAAITPRPLFQHEIDRCIRSTLLTVVARLSDFDIVGLAVARLLPLITAHMHDFYDAERAVRGPELENPVTESEALDMAIAGRYRNGRMHTVAALEQTDTEAAAQVHLRALVAKMLPIVLPDNMKSSRAVTAVVREVVACAVLAPVVRALADPDTWNQIIVNVGGPMLRDRKAVRKVRAALEQNAPVSPKAARGAGAQFPRLRPYDGERQFERFVRSVRHVQNLSDARRFRSEIMSQLRRDAAVEGQDAAYLRRLETGKRLLEQKITSLSANGDGKPKLAVQASASDGESVARKRKATLRELIYDAAGLSYFMEFMDRIQLMRLVQFYLVVDGFRGPLEGDNDELDTSVASDPDRMDIAQMYEGYLNQREIGTSEEALKTVKTYLRKGVDATPEDYVRARQAILQMQTQAYKVMQQPHYENFKHSDLYYKWLAIEDVPTSQSHQPSSPLSPDSPSRSTETSPSRMRRPQLAPANREPELRRAVLSSTNLKDVIRPQAQARRSLDDGKARRALFDDDPEEEAMAGSTASLRSVDSETEAEARAVSAMEVALDGIVADENRDGLFGDGGDVLTRSSMDITRPALPPRPSDRGKPSIITASLGLVGAPSSRGVFVDDLFGDEAQKFVEDEREDSEGPDDSDEDKVQEAAPGDLGLIEAIDVLNADVEKLVAQKQIVASLTAKAELTNNAPELRILRKSEQSLDREIKRKEMQRQQYIIQETDNSLYGRAAVRIDSVMIGKEDDGREFALYVIEVRRQAGEQMAAAMWTVTRRYSQFHELHKRLRARFPSVRELDFPRRQALFTLQKDFVQKRRTVLERYLRSLLLVPAICRSRELRAFLSQSAIAAGGSADASQVDAKDFVTRIYNSVSDGMEDFLGNIPVLDQLSVAGQNLITAAASSSNTNSPNTTTPPSTTALDARAPATSAEAEAELNAYESPSQAQPFITPICDLFLETFELSKGNSWLRGRTAVLVLHQLLGGTIERRVREAVRGAMEDESLVRGVDWVQGVIEAKKTTAVERSVNEKARSRKEAGVILGLLVPDLAGSVVGRGNAGRAGRKVVGMGNNGRLNTHLIFTLLDEIIGTIFPETLEKHKA